jgi:hypothetical protein
MWGNNSPDKEFRSSTPHVAMRLGPYLHLDRRLEVAGVWPLRIPDTETAEAVRQDLIRRIPSSMPGLSC